MTDIVTLYRVEATMGAKPGHGPYATYPAWDDNAEARHYDTKARAMALIDSGDDEHPSPIEDIGIERYIEDRERCAFESMDHARAWFHSGALELLCSTGYYAVFAYVVPRHVVTFGTYQCLFDPDDAVNKAPVDL